MIRKTACEIHKSIVHVVVIRQPRRGGEDNGLHGVCEVVDMGLV